MIRFTNVTKTYANSSEPAVAGLSLTVNPGEIYGFLGPNGAGKTTTIKMIVGLLRPDSGTITVNGIDVREDALSAKRQIGYVPDTPALWDKLTGLEYLGFVGDVFAIPAATRRQRIEQLSAAFDIKGALHEQLGAYSHGMQQKILLLGALLHQPPVWILDEPLVGLDPHTAHVLKELMADHCRKGNTVFFSTHILDVAERLCHRVGIIRKGRLIAEGSLAELRAKQGEGTLEKIFLELTEA
ncbi:MAG: ABC transporter ATP-binding protein [Chloroflexota bacterium]